MSQTQQSLVSVLIADSFQIVRDALRSEFEECASINVLGETNSGIEAISLSLHLQPDVLILEHRLDDCNGFAVIEALANQSYQPAYLVFSDTQTKAVIYNYLLVGAKGILVKSEPIDVLIQSVVTVAQGKYALSQIVQSLLVDIVLGAHQTLSPNEQALMQLLMQGMPNAEIAKELGISIGNVNNTLSKIYRKLPLVRTRAEAVAWAWENRRYSHGVN